MTWLIFFHPHHVSCFHVLFILRIIEYWVAEFWANENNEKSELVFVKCACLASKLCLKCQPKLKLMLTFKTVEYEFVSKNLCWNWSVGENVILTDIANYSITNARIVCDEFTSKWCDTVWYRFTLVCADIWLKRTVVINVRDIQTLREDDWS